MNFKSTKYYLLLLLLCGAPFLAAATVTIQQPYLDTMICQSGSFNVGYTTTGAYNPGNVFTAQLSDANGSFTSIATDIGTLTSTTAGNISVVIPPLQALGSKYRIRIISSNPAGLSIDNGVDIRIFGNIGDTVISNSPVCIGDTLQFKVHPSPITNVLYSWVGPTIFNLNTQNLSFPNATAAFQGNYTLSVVHNGCPNFNYNGTAAVNSAIPIMPSIASNGAMPPFLCSGQNLSFTTTAAGVQYAWTGPNGFTSNAQSPTIPNVTPQASGTYYLIDSLDGCRSAQNSISVLITPSLIPSISVAQTPSGSICSGTMVNFTSVVTNGGTTPGYQWVINDIPVLGATGDHFGANAFSDNDNIYCIVTTSLPTCVANPIDTSNKLTLSVEPSVSPFVTITASPGTTVSQGAAITFTATVVNGGTTPTYQWLVNNVPFSNAIFSTFTIHTLNEGDVVSCSVISNAPCVSIPAITSNSLVVHIGTVDVSQVENAFDGLNLFPSPNNGTFTIKGDITGLNSSEAAIEIINSIGQLVSKQTIPVQNGSISRTIHLTDELSGGIYMLRINAGAENKTYRFSVQR